MKKGFVRPVSPNDQPPTTSSEEVSGLGSVAKCAMSLGENIGARGNVAKDANKMRYDSGVLGQSNAMSRRGFSRLMRPTLSKKDALLLCGFGIAAALPAYFAYGAVGWIGIG